MEETTEWSWDVVGYAHPGDSWVKKYFGEDHEEEQEDQDQEGGLWEQGGEPSEHQDQEEGPCELGGEGEPLPCDQGEEPLDAWIDSLDIDMMIDPPSPPVGVTRAERGSQRGSEATPQRRSTPRGTPRDCPPSTPRRTYH